MPNENMTRKQKTYVDGREKGLTPLLAAERAGYSHPSRAAYRLRNNPVIAAVSRRLIETTILEEGAPIAWQTLREVMQDKTASPAVRVQAAKVTLDKARVGEKTSDAQADLDKPLSEMTAAELERVILNASAAIPNAPHMLDITPRHTLQAIDLPDDFDELI